MSEIKKAIWITGASSGIGKAITEKFVGSGYYVIATSRNQQLLQQLAESLKNSNLIHTYKLDIKNPDEIKKFYENLDADIKVECLINNAGITSFKNAIDDSIPEIEDIINTNLMGSIYSIKQVLPDMIKQNRGTILNVLSVVTKKVFVSSSAYSASKAGLLAYTNVLREEVRGKNIRVINISPGATNTNIWPEKTRNKFSERMMDIDSVAEFVLHLYKEKSNLVAEDIVLRPLTGDL